MLKESKQKKRNVHQAAIDWEVSEYYARKICKRMGLNTRDIPVEAKPVYILDGRLKNNPHRFYLYVLDVIINSHLELENIELDIIATCVEQLNKAGLIVLKYGRKKESVDYHDYTVSANIEIFCDWKNAKTKKKIEAIVPVISAVSEGVAAAGVLASNLK